MPNPTDHNSVELDTPPLPEEMKHAARLTVCRNAIDAIDAAQLLAMLGLTDSEPAAPTDLACSRCQHPGYERNWTNARKANRRLINPAGLCTRCAQIDRDADPATRYRRPSRARAR